MPVPVLTAGQMLAWENASWAGGAREKDVIARVGERVASKIRAMSRAGDRVVMLAGRGHNGDDVRAAVPLVADRDLKPLGYRVTIVSADANDKHNFPGLVAALKDADLLFVSVRRRFPPKEQLDAVRAHLAAGKPLVGIRTASHAFALARNEKLPDPRLATWERFDPEVLGGHYTTYYRNKKITTVALAPGAQTHRITQGLDLARLVGNCPLYIVSPLEPGTVPVLIGSTPVTVGDKTEPRSEPVAWTHRYGPRDARIFYTSLGDADDFKNGEFRRLLVNSVAWALER